METNTNPNPYPIPRRIDGGNTGESLGLILAWLLAWSGAG